MRDNDAIARGLRVELRRDGESLLRNGWRRGTIEMVAGFQCETPHSAGRLILHGLGSAPSAGRQDIGACGPVVPLGGHGFDALWFGHGEVAGFGAVEFGIVQLPGLILHGDELPLAVANGAVALMLPNERFGPSDLRAGQNGSQARAFEWLDFLSAKLGWIGCARNIETGGHDVHELTRLCFKLPTA